MNKNAIKNFAETSKTLLKEKILLKLNFYYVNESFEKTINGDMICLKNSNINLNLTNEEYEKRELLIKRIDEIGIEQVIEESAYTWFNRLIAIRYMEIHDYLPLGKNNESLGIRVLSSNDNTPNPEIMKFSNLMNNQLDINFNQDYYLKLKNDNEKFKYILQLVCNKLKKVFPEVFDGITDYIDLLIPDNMLSDTGFVSKMVTDLQIDDFDSIEIIGWLYQFYVSNQRETIRQKKTYNKNDIPILTQVFTPDWIVKYMVENSLGSIWSLSHKDSNIKKRFNYYIEDESLQNISFNVENFKIIEPCCGSGHILISLFDLLYDIYLELGYNKNDIPTLILKNNLYGLEIDKRAYQLSVFTLLMKSREKNSNFFNNKYYFKPNVYEIIDTKYLIDNDVVSKLDNYIEDKDILKTINKILSDFYFAKEIGSLIKVSEFNLELIINKLEEIRKNASIDLFNLSFINKEILEIENIMKIAHIMSLKYDLLITNPPYLGITSLNENIKKYFINNYPDSKNDMFAMFMDTDFLKENGIMSIVNPDSWMFLISFEKLRNKIVMNDRITSMIHIGTGAFDAAVQTTAFVIQKNVKDNKYGIYYKFINNKNKSFLSSPKYVYDLSQSNYITGNPIAYWINENVLNVFKSSNEKVEKYALSEGKNVTTKNDKYILYNWEIDSNKIGNFNAKWVPCATGGPFRRWYGNVINVIDWSEEARSFYKRNPAGRIIREEFWNMSGVTWGKFGSTTSNFRILPNNYMYQETAILQNDINDSYYILGLLNSNISNYIIGILNPTINLQLQDIKNIPYIDVNDKQKTEVINLVKNIINIAKEDWDNNEISLDFKKNQLLNEEKNIRDAVKKIINNNKERIEVLQKLEFNINECFANIYNLQELFDYNIDEKFLSITKVDEILLVKSIINYTVGCMFGRYSLDKEGLICTNSNFDKNNYKMFEADIDNIIPISDSSDIYYSDDIVAKFKDFIRNAFDESYLEDNLNYIADVIGRKGTESYEETIRRYFINDFYNDHCKMYQKRPIYWMIDSGKNNGFKALIYIHRYDKQLLSKIRVDYLHKTQDAYERIKNQLIVELEKSNSIKNIHNQINNINMKIDECNKFDEKLGHLANQMIDIDLDDGVKVNYEKFADILAKIK